MPEINPNQFKEVSNESWLSRIGGSFIGFLIGIILIPAMIFLLSWNEGRAVSSAKSLNLGRSAVVEVSSETMDPSNEQKLIYVVGQLTTQVPAVDPLTNLTVDNLVRLKRDVSIYQWVEKVVEKKTENVGGSQTTEKEYNYSKDWSSQPIDSRNFKIPAGHQNPKIDISSESFDADEANLGVFSFKPMLETLQNYETLSQLPNPPEGFEISGSSYYKGKDINKPEIGDVKINYSGIVGQKYSIVAQQSEESLTPFVDPKTDYSIALVKSGQVSVDKLFAEQENQEKIETWALRALGFVFMVVGFKLLFGPIEMLAAFLPFLKHLIGAGTFVVSLLLAVPVTLITIAIAWISNRPLISVAMLVISLIFGFLFYKRSQSKKIN
jgi:hypothetical protein